MTRRPRQQSSNGLPAEVEVRVQPAEGPSPGSYVEVCRATGSPIEECVAQVREGYGVEPGRVPELVEWAKQSLWSHSGDSDSLSSSLEQLFECDPGLANDALSGLDGLDLGDCFTLGPAACSELTCLPKGLRVSGYCDLTGCTKLTSFPEGYQHNGGSLCLKDCTALEHLPDTLEIPGWLVLDGCSRLVHLPKGLKVQSLSVEHCESWDGTIPHGVIIKNGLNDDYNPNDEGRGDEGTIPLEDWREEHAVDLKELISERDQSKPPYETLIQDASARAVHAETVMRGHRDRLDALKCEMEKIQRAFNEAAAILREAAPVVQELSRAYCREPRAMRPDELFMKVDPKGVWDTLKATGAADSEALRQMWETSNPRCRLFAMERLTRMLRVEPGLQEAHLRVELLQETGELAPELAELVWPTMKGLFFHGNVYLDDAFWMKELPSDLRVEQDFHLYSCQNLIGARGSIDVGGHFNLADCTRLESLPQDTRVGLSLVLKDCKALRSLPAGLKVGRDLNMGGCSTWDEVIPEDAEIAGRIHTDVYPNGLSLKNWRSEERKYKKA